MTSHVETKAVEKPRETIRRRRWPIVLGTVLAAMAVLVLLLPAMLSTSLARNRILAMVNNRLKGNVRLADLTTSWGGPTQLRGLQVSDPEGRTVLDVKAISWSRGVWGALTSQMKFDKVKIDSPRVILRLDRNGTPSLARAVESRSPSPPATEKEAGTLPAPIGSVVVEGGGVQIIRENLTPYELPSIAATIDLDTLSHVRGNLNITTTESGIFRSDFNVEQLVKEGQFTLGQARGTVKAETTGALEIGPLLAIATESGNAGGRLELNVNAVLETDRAKVDFASRVAALKAGRPGQEDIRPIDLNLQGSGRRAVGKLTAEAVVSGPPGRFESQLIYLESKQPTDLSTDKLMATILRGEKHPLPEFTMTAAGKMDIPTLSKAIPALLAMQSGVEILTGGVEINDIRIQGGNQPIATGTVQLTQITAKRGAREITLQPIVAGFDTTIETGQGLAIRRGILQSEFAQAAAKGTIRDLEMTLQADLAKAKQFGEVFELPVANMAGTVNGTARLARANEERLNVAFDLAADGLQYKTGKGMVQAQRSKVNGKASCELANGKLQKANVDEVVVTIDDGILAKGAGRYDADKDSLHGEVNVERVNLDYAAKLAGTLGIQGPETMGGSLVLSVKADKASPQASYVLAANGQVNRLVVGAGKKAFQEAQIRFSARTDVDPGKQVIAMDQFELASSPLTVQAKGTLQQYREKGVMDVSGKYQASWDRITDLLHQFAEDTKQTISMTGRSESAFTLRGPMTDPVLEELDAQSGISWNSGRAYGLALGKAALPLLIQKARFDLPRTPIPASDGFVRMGGFIDFRESANLRMPGTVNLLDNIRIDKEIGQQLLSRINPIFGYLAELDGRATLQLTELDVPLSQAIKTRGTGRGRLDLSKVRMQPTTVLAQLMQLATPDLKKNYSPTVSGADFIIDKGCIRYENFIIAFPEDSFDMIFSGSIALYDGTVNMVVSLPLRSAMYGRIGLKGLAPDDAQLKGRRISLPLVGTRTNLKVDLSNAAIRKILTDSLKGAGLAPGKGFDQILGPPASGKNPPSDQGKNTLQSLLPRQKGSSSSPGGKGGSVNKLQDLLGGGKKK